MLQINVVFGAAIKNSRNQDGLFNVGLQCRDLKERRLNP